MTDKINWKPHPTLEGYELAKRNGYSLVRGPYIRGIEVMDLYGDCRSGYTEKQALKITK